MTGVLAAWRAGGAGGEVAVLGLGRSGTAAARLLRAHGVPVYASDRGTPPAAWDGEDGRRLAAAGVVVEWSGHDLARIRRAVGVVLSPGIPPDAPAVAAARDAGVPVRAEIDLALEVLGDRSRIIAVTGTNGKTTTTALVAHLLQAGGRDAVAAGNIGRPLSDLALAAVPPPWIALEVSSFQLHDTMRLAPAVGVLTNLAPDHLDRYATVAEYYEDKKRLFLHARPESVWILNADDRDVGAMTRGVAGRVVQVSTRTHADAWWDRDAGLLRLEGACLLPRTDLHLLGGHNVANALMAAAAAREAGVDVPALAAGLASFAALPHRLEPVGAVDGVLWINDSKATNVASTQVAVDAMDRPFVLLLGGRHKGEPYSELGHRLTARCRGVVAFGEAAPLIEADLGAVIGVERAASFDEVLQRARAMAQPGDAVLLSPACSSYDMFRNYEERGARFRAAVMGS